MTTNAKKRKNINQELVYYEGNTKLSKKWFNLQCDELDIWLSIKITCFEWIDMNNRESKIVGTDCEWRKSKEENIFIFYFATILC